MSSYVVSFRRRAAQLSVAFAAMASLALPQTPQIVEASARHGSQHSAALVNGEFRLRHATPQFGPSRIVARNARGREPCSTADICTETIFKDDFEPPCVALPTGCGAIEICGNGADDDCNGEVDDGCPCLPGAQQSCFSGTPGQRNTVVCADGMQTCIGSEFGTWGPCVGGVAPSVEVCDGLDNDCNGCVEK